MAKCIKEVGTKNYSRVPNEIAESKVASGKFEYVSKSEWKRNCRDAEKKDTAKVEEVKSTPKLEWSSDGKMVKSPFDGNWYSATSKQGKFLIANVK